MRKLSRKQSDAPGFYFYVKDWLGGDNALRACPRAAKGLWIDLLAIMWQAPMRGAIEADPVGIAAMTGGEIEECVDALAILDRRRVFSWLINKDTPENSPALWRIDGKINPNPAPNAFIICRRMYRDHRLSEIRAEAGRAGGFACQAKGKQSLAKDILPRKQNFRRKLEDAIDLAALAESKSIAKQGPSDPIPIQIGRSYRDIKPIRDRLVSGIGNLQKHEIYSLEAPDMIELIARMDSGNPLDRARRNWAKRINAIIEAGNAPALRELLVHVWHATTDSHSGVGILTNPAAFLNDQTKALTH